MHLAATMIRPVLVLLFAGLLTLQVDSRKTNQAKVEPYDLIDEADEELEDLKEIVQGAITTALDNLQTSGLNFLTYSDNTLQDAQVAIQQQQDTIDEQFTVIKDLGLSSGKDVSSCLNVGDQLFSGWPIIFFQQITTCINDINGEVDGVLQDAHYFVDVYINKVDELEFQLGLCASGSILCISPIISQIETGMVELPQKIEVEVDSAQSRVETLKISIQNCANTKVTQFIAQTNNLIEVIAFCVDSTISS